LYEIFRIHDIRLKEKILNGHSKKILVGHKDLPYHISKVFLLFNFVMVATY